MEDYERSSAVHPFQYFIVVKVNLCEATFYSICDPATWRELGAEMSNERMDTLSSLFDGFFKKNWVGFFLKFLMIKTFILGLIFKIHSIVNSSVVREIFSIFQACTFAFFSKK